MSRVREFSLALMGYDRRQVDDFSEEMDAIVEQLRQQVARLTDELDQLRQAKPITADQAFANVGRETQQILQAAQQAGARMLSDARSQSESEVAAARRERSQIVGDGYRARDEMSEQLRRLDDARTQLVRQLPGAAAEVERVAAGLESDTSTSMEAVRRASTGTDAARPRTSGRHFGWSLVATIRHHTGHRTRSRRRRRRRGQAVTCSPTSGISSQRSARR